MKSVGGLGDEIPYTGLKLIDYLSLDSFPKLSELRHRNEPFTRILGHQVLIGTDDELIRAKTLLEIQLLKRVLSAFAYFFDLRLTDTPTKVLEELGVRQSGLSSPQPFHALVGSGPEEK